MSLKNSFNSFYPISQSPYQLKTDTKNKMSSRLYFDIYDKSDDESGSENEQQSLFSNFYFNKTMNGSSKYPGNLESLNDSKVSLERSNQKSLSIKFTRAMGSFEKLGNDDKSSKKNKSKILYPFAENDDLDKKSNNSFHSTKGKTISTTPHQIRYSIDRNFKFDYEALKDSLNTNYHPKFWTNEDIQKLYSGKLKFHSVNSSSNCSFMGNKADEDLKT